MQLIPSLAIEHIGVKDLEAALGKELAAVSVFLVGDVAVVAMPGQLEALPEVHHIGEVLNGVLWTDEAEIDEPFTTEKVEAGQRPAHGRILDLDAGVARAVADLFGRHARLDFA